MKFYVEKSLSNFEFWGGAERVHEKISSDQLDSIEAELEMIEPEDGWSETAINDLFWFEPDFVASLIGYSSWENLEEDVSDEDIVNAEDWAADLCDEEDFETMDKISEYKLDIVVEFEDEDEDDGEDEDEFEDEKENNISKFQDWWDNLTDIKKVKLYKDFA